MNKTEMKNKLLPKDVIAPLYAGMIMAKRKGVITPEYFKEFLDTFTPSLLQLTVDEIKAIQQSV